MAGLLDEAVSHGRRGIELADRSEDADSRMITRTTAADSLQQRGDRDAARALLAEAERMQVEQQPQFPLLYSLRGFQYADLILAPAERAAWRACLTACPAGRASRSTTTPSPLGMGLNEERSAALAACTEAQRRAVAALPIAERNHRLLDIALDHLTLARASLYRAVFEADFAADSALQPAATELNQESPSALALHRWVRSGDCSALGTGR